MGLKRYTHTTVADTAATLFTVAAGHELAVVSIEIAGGTNGGDITLTRNDGTNDIFAQSLTLDADDSAVLDHKMFFEAGDVFKVQANAAGLIVCVNASDDEV